MVKKFQVCVEPLTGDKPRTAYVYLPESYKKSRRRRYPVLYMFDGHNVFFDEDATYGKSWGMAKYLDALRADLIVAAVECNHEGNGRLIEYSPTPIKYKKEILPASGRETMEWMVNEFKPYIDSHYRTMKTPDKTGICGSSMGGLMALFAACEYSHVFGKAAALSPSLWLAGKTFMDLMAKASIRPGTRIYMDCGSKEFDSRGGGRRAFQMATDILLRKETFVTSRIVPNGEHCEASWEKQIPIFMGVLGMFD
ncbi:MAG: alpha/beta hydrolase [Lachnospiraceae bacterium]|nr:alpha/beta hydrolase [Lachnospiraceae bacterium]